MIINEEALLEDSIDILVEHFEWDEEKAKEKLNEHEIAYIVNKMYQAQEQYLEELGNDL